MPIAPPPSGEYSTALSEHGDLMSVDDFNAACEVNGFIDYDGFGHPAKDGKQDSRIVVFPSERHRTLPKDATHIVWFNK